MKCPFCKGEVPLPPIVGGSTSCLSCGQEFEFLGDWGWWSITAEVYIPKQQGEKEDVELDEETLPEN